MNMVGTPCSAVQRSDSIDSSTAPGSNPADGNTIAAPCVAHNSVPSTMPKQWYIGTGIQSLSASEKPMISAAMCALFTML